MHIEDRNNHEITKALYGADKHWPNSIHPNEDGFIFEPDRKRRLDISLKGGEFYSEPEWYYQIPHPVDRERGRSTCWATIAPNWLPESTKFQPLKNQRW
jgi:hypothetical protein